MEGQFNYKDIIRAYEGSTFVISIKFVDSEKVIINYESFDIES